MVYQAKRPQIKAYIRGSTKIASNILKINFVRLYSCGRNRHVRAIIPKSTPIIADLISKKPFAIIKVSNKINNTFNKVNSVFNVVTKYLAMKGV